MSNAALYQLLPRKIAGFFAVALVSNPLNIQYRSAIKRNCLDWLADNQPQQPAACLNDQVGAQVWRARVPLAEVA